MDTQPLFLDAPLHFDGEEKLAGMQTRLGDNVDNWPQEITQEAYKQIPYLSDFETNVVLDKVDEQKGFAWGSIEVRPKTAMTQEEQTTSQLDKVHIPIVVRDQMLAPFDVFLHGKNYQHLTEGRLRMSLFRPETMDAARARPPDPSLINELQPPIRAGYGGFGSGAVKMGSELRALPILPQLHGQVLPEHLDRLKVACQDPSLRVTLDQAHEGVKAAFASALNLSLTDLEKSAEVVRTSIRPTVVQIRGLPNGNAMVKWANTDMYAPQEEEVPMDVAQDLSGEEDLTGLMEPDGTITASPDAPIKQTMDAEEIKVADSFGLWKVQDTNGNTMIGWVFPQLLSMDMISLPLSLFNNGSQYALQEHVAGEIAGKSVDLPKGQPAGYGCLYYIDHGTAKAFLPMTVGSTMRGPDGTVQYNATNEFGDVFTFYFSDAMKKVMKVGDSSYCVPTSVNWMPLRGKTELVEQPMAFSKTASKDVAKAELVGDGAVFSWRGPAVAKLASDQTKFINRDQAEFLGVAMGISPPFCKKAVARAAKGELMTFDSLHPITPFAEKMKEKQAEVKKELKELEIPIRNFFLAKEASILDDALTADKILGLGFLNAENVATFVDMLPGLEAASSKLAELLVAVRLGLKDVPEVAVERMLAALEDVIRGLRSLQQKEIRYTD
jgi:hypothetical protein